MIRILERSKKYMTETEEPSSGSAKEEARLNKDGSLNTEKRFNVRNIVSKLKENQRKNSRIFLTKVMMWLLPCLMVFMGHFYCAIFILWTASMLHMEVIQMGNVMQKDHEIKYSWLDVYWYAVGAYICIPYAFLRRKLTEKMEI